MVPVRFVEFETSSDLKVAIEKLDGREFKGAHVTCTQDVRSYSPQCYFNMIMA